MLERTTACLEAGSLRHLLPGQSKYLKSKHALHPSFWYHSANELELSPTWSALFKRLDAIAAADIHAQHHDGGSGSFLVGFLYFPGIFRFLQTHSTWDVDRLDARRTRVLGAVGHRSYTSLSKHSSTPSEDKLNNSSERSGDTADQNSIALANLLDSENTVAFEDVWRRHSQLTIKGQKESATRVLMYLSKSSHIAVAERITDIFSTLHQDEKDAQIYRIVIKAYLKLKDFPQAMKIHADALLVCESPAVSTELFGYLVSKSLWEEAFNVWSHLEEHKLQYQHDQHCIVSTLQMNRRFPLYVRRLIDTGTPESLRGNQKRKQWRRFVCSMVESVMLDNRHYNEKDFNHFFSVLTGWKQVTTKLQYDTLLFLLEVSSNRQLITRFYQTIRIVPEITFSKTVLIRLLHLHCNIEDRMGIQAVLDDFFRLGGGIPREAYRVTLSFFARHGDAQTVHALFNQYDERFRLKGKERMSSSELGPILTVHARRGEIKDVVKHFDEIETKWQLRPNILCWNILIDAYGRVHDINGAFRRFQQLLESDLEPDEYTFGTMMSICANQGDRECVMQIWELAKLRNVRVSGPMIACLVQVHIQDDMLEEAEQLCVQAATQSIRGPLTGMWNRLINAYAMRLNISEANRIMKRMADFKIEYNGMTYAAIMQVLAMTDHPIQAEQILRGVLPRSGIKVTSHHYAVVMGAHLRQKKPGQVHRLHREMVEKGLGRTASTRIAVLVDAIVEDQRANDPEGRRFKNAIDIFESVVRSLDPQDVVISRKGLGKFPLDTAYATSCYTYFIKVLAKLRDKPGMEQLLGQYQAMIPSDSVPPLEILQAFMLIKHQEGSQEGIEELWNKAKNQAIKEGQPIVAKLRDGNVAQKPGEYGQVLYKNRFNLCKVFAIYMQHLESCNKIDQLITSIAEMESYGFVLDLVNWNNYIQVLARAQRWQLAFELCESHLMPGFTGWRRLRPFVEKIATLPRAFQTGRWQRGHARPLRPISTTMLFLIKAWLQLTSLAASSRSIDDIMVSISASCPMTLEAMRTMVRQNDEEEKQILGGEGP